jgi:hypothetical protein
MMNQTEQARRAFFDRRQELQRDCFRNHSLTWFGMEVGHCYHLAKEKDRAAINYAAALAATGVDNTVTREFHNATKTCNTFFPNMLALITKRFILPSHFNCMSARASLLRAATNDLENGGRS